jgi:FMN phosphatase YigB (HAD superfamily)
MIKLALFDLGETLLQGTTPFPNAIAALEAISRLHTEAGEPLILGLVSDFLPADPPVTEAKIAAREQEYRDILDGARLKEFFEPFSSHVTLSTRAGVNKPDRRIFELAIKRSGVGASLDECTFTTETTEHLAKCKSFGMVAIRFGTGPGISPAFSNWSDAPHLFAGLLGRDDAHNQAVVTAAELSVRHNLAGFVPSAPVQGREHRGQARQLVELKDPKLGDLDGLYVELPTEVTVSLGKDRHVANVAATPPGKDEVADAVNFVAGLARAGKIAIPGRPAIGATHAIEQDAHGRKCLVRRGYRAY